MSLVARLCSGVAWLAKKMPRNDYFYGYEITLNGDVYMTRVLTPRMFGQRAMLHHIHRPDADRHPHNHPWARAVSLLLSGGYTEHRVLDGCGQPMVLRLYKAGDVNVLGKGDFHIIKSVEPNTWSLFIAGERVQEWGYLVDRRIVHHSAYNR